MNKVLLGAVSASLLALAACNGTASVAPDTDMDSSTSSVMMEESSAMMQDSSAMMDSSATSEDTMSSTSSMEGAAASVAVEVEAR